MQQTKEFIDTAQLLYGISQKKKDVERDENCFYLPNILLVIIFIIALACGLIMWFNM